MNSSNMVQVYTSLPPCIKKVDPFFYLHFQINNIKFTTKTLINYDHIDARVIWWGEEGKGSIFTPRCANLAGYKQTVKTHAIYKVCVPLHHLTTYLSDMDKLHIDIIDKSKQSVIGRAFVEDVKQLGCNKTLRSLCSIYNEAHSKIGEIMVFMAIEPGTATISASESDLKIKETVEKDYVEKRLNIGVKPSKVVTEITDHSKQLIDDLIVKGKRLRETIAINVKDDEINEEIARRTFPHMGKNSDDEWLKGVLAEQSTNYISLNDVSKINTESILKSSPIMERKRVNVDRNNDIEALKLLTVNDSYFSESDGDYGRYKYLGRSDEDIIALDRHLSSDDDPGKRDSIIEELLYKQLATENDGGKDSVVRTKNLKVDSNSKNRSSLKSDFEIYRSVSQNQKCDNISPRIVEERGSNKPSFDEYDDDNDDDNDVNQGDQMSAEVVDSSWYRQISAIRVFLDMLWLNSSYHSPCKAPRSRSQSPNCSSDRERVRRSQDSSSSFNNSSAGTSASKPPVSRSIQWNPSCNYFIEYKLPLCAPTEGGLEKENLATPRCPTRVPVRSADGARFNNHSNPNGVKVFELNCVSEFPVAFDNATIGKWWRGVVKFRLIVQDRISNKETVVGVSVLPLRNVISTDNFYRMIPVRLPRNKLNKAKVVVGSLAIRTTMTVSAPPSGLSQPSRGRAGAVTDHRQRQHHAPRSTVTVPRNPPPRVQEKGEPVRSRPTPRMSPINLVSLLSVSSVRYVNTKMASGDYRSGTRSYNLYFIGRLLWAPDHKIKSRTLWGSSKLTDAESPVDLENFKLCERLPLILTSELLERLRNNFAVLEVWDRGSDGERDSLYGLAKVPMDVLCMSFGNDHIRRTVLGNVYPVMCCDDWVNIEDTMSGKSKGQMHVTLALGSQQQIDNLQLSKENTLDGHWNRSIAASGTPHADLVEHSIEIGVESLRNLSTNLLSDLSTKDCFCYVQYYFPHQQSITEVNSRTWVTTTFRSVSHPIQANVDISDTNKHRFRLPIDCSLKAALNSHFEVVGKKHFLFELYVKQYSPFPSSRSIAKGRLQVSSLFQLINQHSVSVDSMADTLTQQQMPIRLTPSDESQTTDSIGTLNICVCYRTRLLENTSRNVPSSSLPSPLDQPIVKIELLSATGLQKAAEMLVRIHPELEYASVTGVNSHIKYWLTDENNKQSRINVNSKGFQKFKVHKSKTVPRSFTPKYESVSEALLGPIIDDRDSNALCRTLAEKILIGVYQLNVEVYHDVPKSIYCDFNEDSATTSSILICKGRISLADMLLRSSGVMGPIWLTLFSPMDLDSAHSGCRLNITGKKKSDSLYTIEKRKAVGAVEIRLSFNDKVERRNVLQLALDVGYVVPWTSRLDAEDLMWQTMDVHGCGFKNLTVTVEEVELSSKLINCVFAPEAGFKQSSMKILTRYRLYKQSIASSPFFMLNEEELMERIFIPVNHRQQYCYKVSGDLFRYLRESKLEVQVWAIYGKANTAVSDNEDEDHRIDSPNDVRLLGGAFFDLSSLILPNDASHRTVSHILPLWKRGVANCDNANVTVTVDICGATSPLSNYTSDNDDENEGGARRTCGLFLGEQNWRTEDSGRRVSQKSFPAHVIIEKAVNLVALPTRADGRPLHYVVTFPCYGDTGAIQSTVVKGSKEVSWNFEVDTRLPYQLLSGNDDTTLDFKLYYSSTESEVVEEISDEKVLVGIVRLDMSLLLRGGFERVIGWYNVVDRQGDCRGQMKVGVTPLVPLVPRTAAVAAPRSLATLTEVAPLTLKQHRDYLASVRMRLHGSTDVHPLLSPSIGGPLFKGHYETTSSNQETVSTSVLYGNLRDRLEELGNLTDVFKERVNSGGDAAHMRSGCDDNNNNAAIEREEPREPEIGDAGTNARQSYEEDFEYGGRESLSAEFSLASEGEEEGEHDRRVPATVCINDIDGVASDSSIEEVIRREGPWRRSLTMEDHCGDTGTRLHLESEPSECHSVYSCDEDDDGDEHVAVSERSVSAASEGRCAGAETVVTACSPPRTDAPREHRDSDRCQAQLSPAESDLSDSWEAVPPAHRVGDSLGHRDPPAHRTTVIPRFFPPSLDFQEKMKALKRNIDVQASSTHAPTVPREGLLGSQKTPQPSRVITDTEAERLSRIFGIRRL